MSKKLLREVWKNRPVFALFGATCSAWLRFPITFPETGPKPHLLAVVPIFPPRPADAGVGLAGADGPLLGVVDVQLLELPHLVRVLALQLHVPLPVDVPHDGGGAPDEAEDGKAPSQAVVRKVIFSICSVPSVLLPRQMKIYSGEFPVPFTVVIFSVIADLEHQKNNE